MINTVNGRNPNQQVLAQSLNLEAFKSMIYRQRFDSPKPFDLVIVDLTIPGGLGGKETLAELQKIDGKVRVIFPVAIPMIRLWPRTGNTASLQPWPNLISSMN